MTKQPPRLANVSERCCLTDGSRSPALLPLPPRENSLMPNHGITPIFWQPPIQSKPYFPEHKHKPLKRPLSGFLKEMPHVLPKGAVSFVAGSISKPSVVGYSTFLVVFDQWVLARGRGGTTLVRRVREAFNDEVSLCWDLKGKETAI